MQYSLTQYNSPGLSTNLGQLEGLILLDKSSPTTVITYFPTAELPLDVKSRFETLFGVQEKWTYDEIRPFLEYVVFFHFPCLLYSLYVSNLLSVFINIHT